MSDLSLTAAARISSGILELRYELRNGARQDVYLLNRLFVSVQELMSPDVIYIDPKPDAKIVELGKYLADLPGQPNPSVPVAPFVTPVRAGESFVEIVRMALPLRRYMEYEEKPAPADTDRIETYDGLDMRLGLYWREPGVYEDVTSAFGQEVIIPKGYKGFPRFETLHSGIVRLPIPVSVPQAGAPPPEAPR